MHPPAVSGRSSRALWLTSRPSAWTLLVPLVALLAGLLFTASSQVAQGTDLRADPGGLREVIGERQYANALRTGELAAVRTQVEQLTRQAAPGSADLGRATARAESLALAAGTQAVRGPALSVALNDSSLPTDQLPDWADVDDIVVHQQDVQAVVNALWRGGAEAMMVMDQRIVSTSAVRCVGNTLILQGRVYSPPFVITAMGDPAALRAALDADPTITRYQEYVAALGLGYAVEDLGTRAFPGFTGQLTLGEAHVAD